MKLIRIAYKESWWSIAKRFCRALWKYLNRPAWGPNHFCPGESGSGEWCCRSTVPSVCGYCGEHNLPNAKEHQQPGEKA